MLTHEDVKAFLELDRPTFESGWEAGFRAGFFAGRDVGWGHAHEELREDWQQLARRVVAICGGPKCTELRALRDRPTGELYEAALARRGGRPYTGGPVPWESGSAAA